MTSPPFTIIQAMRLLRQVKDIDMKTAKIEAVEFFDKKGWEVPDYFRK